MKKFILTLICLFCFNLNCFAGEQEAIDSFKAMANNIVSEIQESYNHGAKVEYMEYKPKFNIGDYWYKYQMTNLKVEFEVQKTDSLISPYKGILELQADKIWYISKDNSAGHFATKEEAEKVNSSKYNPAYSVYRFTYMYQGDSWVLKDVCFRFLDEYSWKDDEIKTPQQIFKM